MYPYKLGGKMIIKVAALKKAFRLKKVLKLKKCSG